MWTLEDAKNYFAKDKYATVSTGIEILEVGENYAKCAFKIDERQQNAVGHVMGGAIFTLADFVFAVTTNTTEKVTVTAMSSISYFSSPKGSILYGESKMKKEGKKNCFYEIDIYDDLGTSVACVSTSGVHLA